MYTCTYLHCTDHKKPNQITPLHRCVPIAECRFDVFVGKLTKLYIGTKR